MPSHNPLADPATVAQVVRAARPGPRDLVVEVGAGEGFLTRALARECGKVVAYESDAALAKRLKTRCRGKPKIECVHGDLLSATPPPEPFALVGNVPSAITSQVADWCLGAPGLTSATMVTRLEHARESSGDHGRWSPPTVRTWPWFHWRLLGTVSRGRLRPVPSAESGIVRLDRRPAALLPGEALPEYEEFVAVGFGGAGGGLHAALSEHYPAGEVTAALEAVGPGAGTLVASVHPDQWIALFTALRRH